MKFPPPMPYEVMKIANLYGLISMGLTYQDIQIIPGEYADKLMMLHKEVKDYEADEMEKANKKARGKK